MSGVLRLTAAMLPELPIKIDPGDGVFDGGVCLVCGCTEDAACPGGCGWENDDCNLCSACAEDVLAITEPPFRNRLAVETVIRRQDNPNVLALALEYATGDWRRSLIRLRLRDLGRLAAENGLAGGGR